MGFKKTKMDIVAEVSGLPELLLVKPNHDIYEENISLLDRTTADDLKTIFPTFRSLIAGKNVFLVDNRTKEKELFMPAMNLLYGKKVVKFDYLCFYSAILSCRENVELYCSTFSESVKKLYRAVYDKAFVSLQEANSILGREAMVVEEVSYFRRKRLADDLPFLGYVTSKNGKTNRYGLELNDIFIYMKSFYYNVFYYFVYNDIERGKIKGYDKLPENENLNIFNGELCLMREFPFLLSLSHQGVLKIGTSKKMSVSLLKKVSSQIKLMEFYPEKSDKKDAEVSKLRATLLLNAFTAYMEDPTFIKKDESLENIMKDVMIRTVNKTSLQLNLLLPHISGLRSNYYSYNYVYDINDSILHFFGECLRGKWYSVDDLISFLQLETDGASLRFFELDSFNIQKVANKKNNELISTDAIVSNVSVPFVKYYILMMSSLGMLDVAYSDYNESFNTDADGVKWFRLTNLAYYALGIDKKYTPQQILAEKNYFEVDSDRLIVKSLDKNNPYEGMLNDISTPIGGGRYVFTEKSFLKNCNSETDVSDKISLFERFVCSEKPPLWNRFFASLLDKCSPLKSLNQDSYLIYSLDKDNRELIELLALDPVLRELVIRAEGYIILVEKKNNKKVIDRLKSLGYLI